MDNLVKMTLKKTWDWLGQFDLKKLLDVITFTLVVSGALTALDYFTAKPSMRVYRVEGSHPLIDYNFGKIRKFYDDNNLRIPDKLLEILQQKPDSDEIYGSVISESDIEFVKPIREPGKWGMGRMAGRIKKLEHQIRHYNDYRRRGPIRGYSWTGQEQFERILDYIKEQKMPQNAYFTFLLAGINTRRINEEIVFQNNGETDLRNVRIVITAPISPTSNTNWGKILHIEHESWYAYEVQQLPDRVVINAPAIWPMLENLPINITTQENQLDINRIQFSFEEERIINIPKVYKTTLRVFLITVVFSLIFRGRKKR